ncbi:hypothetical protein PHLCEN_2v10577 [Hermanssonia centrifuga]|uniref:Uncharacterized protein n=1 Tax=Hermanssonia centrifuga TaxID=98765 RepID=A0A2R6NMP0_9APHY|nr:hypothetical protein PHLCEN_2v10577 [Hermanssonia centrifuga]
MATTPAPNSRASLLSGLRTGGVRSTSGPAVPHTASPAGTFNIPRYTPGIPNDSLYAADEEDEFADAVPQNMYIKNNVNRMQQPMTAAVDGAYNRFSQHQTMGMNAGNPMSPFMSAAAAQSQMQAMQMQMMQMEIARLQAQQYQAELLAQAQLQRAPQAQRRSTMGMVPPATAGPTNTAFDIRSIMSGQARRNNQADQLRAMLGVGNDDQMPMTAALGGKFGSRATSGQWNVEDDDASAYLKNPPMTPSYTTVISGGTSLGSNSAHSGNSTPAVPSKSDSAVSWRRGGNNNSVLSGNRAVTSPLVRITPPPVERNSPSPPHSSPVKTRPPALRFTPEVSEPLNAVAIDNDGTDGDDSSSMSSKSGSTPSTPRTASSMGDAPPLSPREEASKKLYEGLGLGRVPTIAISAAPPPVQRVVAHPVRMPRGPPSNNDELLPKNFATRSRRKAIGALGALLDAREKREVIEAA